MALLQEGLHVVRERARVVGHGRTLAATPAELLGVGEHDAGARQVDEQRAQVGHRQHTCGSVEAIHRSVTTAGIDAP